ncbi:S-layer homology domain-containing protein [Paenibacillus chungangensis]|uniref:S-layer homology domain-containing protein n=1 Tax=Paenibacillus chungangensis TaxID=696535 RepID=A0ABW3HWB9_9BACL
MNRRASLLIIMLSLLLLINATPSMAAVVVEKEAGDISFHFTVTERNDRDVIVAVHATGSQDLYAYDMVLDTDAERLQLKNVSIEIAGFTVGPMMEEGNLIRIAHTKTGPSPGENGEVKLATLMFERLRDEPTAIWLRQVKLVDSKLEMAAYEPHVKAMIMKFPSFMDIEGHWAESDIQEAVIRGVATGYENGAFRPQREVTRAEFAAMLIRAMNIPVPEAKELPFSDKDGIPLWAAPFIAAAVDAKLMAGYEDGTFRWNQRMNREELAAVMARTVGFEAERVKGANMSPSMEPTDLEPVFADSRQISEWARPYIATVVEAGLMKGRGEKRFVPEAWVTRAEAVVVLLRR